MRTLASVLLTIACTVSANQTRIVDGNYLRYEASGYESMFFPCGSAEVWSITGGAALDSLVDYYRNLRTDASGESRTTLMLSVSTIDKTEHPGSQVEAVARVVAILSISEDESEIAACRNEPQ